MSKQPNFDAMTDPEFAAHPDTPEKRDYIASLYRQANEATWVVHDMAHEHRLCLNDKHAAEFGPMSEAQAKEMVARNPRGYWAQNLAAKQDS